MKTNRANLRVGREQLPRCRRCRRRRASTPTDLCESCLSAVYRNPADGPRAPTDLRERRIAYYTTRAALGVDLHADPAGRPV